MSDTAIFEGIVVRAHGNSFIVRHNNQDIPCKIRGRLRFKSDAVAAVAVGDDVAFALDKGGAGVIESIKPRRSMFFRPAKGKISKKQIIAANIDRLAAVASVKNPPLKPGLIDRFLISADIGNLTPLVIINKTDLDRPEILQELKRGYGAIKITIHFVSAKSGEGLEALTEALDGHRTIFAGHSGVGKTALINRLIPGLNLKEGEVSEHTDRGIHTTTVVELFELPFGGFVVDSPGLKVLGIWDLEKDDVVNHYPEFFDYACDCRFPGCAHGPEPDCAVKAAVESGKIPEYRYRSYLAIRESV